MAAITQLGLLGPQRNYSPSPFADKTSSTEVFGSFISSITFGTSFVGAADQSGVFASSITFAANLIGAGDATGVFNSTIVFALALFYNDPLSAGVFGISSGITGGEVDDF